LPPGGRYRARGAASLWLRAALGHRPEQHAAGCTLRNRSADPDAARSRLQLHWAARDVRYLLVLGPRLRRPRPSLGLTRACLPHSRAHAHARPRPPCLLDRTGPLRSGGLSRDESPTAALSAPDVANDRARLSGRRVRFRLAGDAESALRQ